MARPPTGGLAPFDGFADFYSSPIGDSLWLCPAESVARPPTGRLAVSLISVLVPTIVGTRSPPIGGSLPPQAENSLDFSWVVCVIAFPRFILIPRRCSAAPIWERSFRMQTRRI